MEETKNKDSNTQDYYDLCSKFVHAARSNVGYGGGDECKDLHSLAMTLRVWEVMEMLRAPYTVLMPLTPFKDRFLKSEGERFASLANLHMKSLARIEYPLDRLRKLMPDGMVNKGVREEAWARGELDTAKAINRVMSL
tara:strand:- start:44945 stop:45358 length:414 start_codon:yes stop_codon:yes gene_type:complete